MCNLHLCYTFCTGVTLFALVLHLNCTALSQSESSNFFMYIINFIVITNCAFSCPSYLNVILLNNYKVTLYTRNRCITETKTARTEDVTSLGFSYCETS